MKRILSFIAGLALLAGASRAKTITLLNVSYDPTRELYKTTTPPSPNTGREKPATT